MILIAPVQTVVGVLIGVIDILVDALELDTRFPDVFTAQVDVKRRYDDGSVRFAIVSLVLDRLPPNASMVLRLEDGRTVGLF